MPSAALPLANSMYGPGGATLPSGGVATVTVPSPRPTTLSITVRWSASTMWVMAELRTSATDSIVAESPSTGISNVRP